MSTSLNVLRSLVVVLGLGAAVFAGGVLMAVPRAATSCCNSSEECGPDEFCCDPRSVGEFEDCFAKAPGYCRTACVSGR